ncbi:MAG TPA: MFS transporter [Candidatus Dormibacteraeota bacterium]
MPEPDAPRVSTPRILTEPRRPARIRAMPSAPWLAVGTVCVGAFMGQLDASIVSTALPVLRLNLHASIAAVEWVVVIYVLVLAGTVAAVGKLADRIGRKLLYTYGFGIFVVGSAACALAPSLGLLVAARFVQAVGAVMLQANSYALIRDVLPTSKLGTGLGIQGAAQAVGLTLGPVLGGALTALGGWRWIFLVNVPIGVVGLALGWFLLPRSTHRDAESRIDAQGTVLLAAIPSAALAALSLAAQPDTPMWTIVALGILACLLAYAAYRRQRRAPGAVIDDALVRVAAFIAGISAALLSYVVLFSCLVAVPFFLEREEHLGLAAAGLELTALPLALAIVAPFGGAIRDRAGPRLPAGAGMAITAAAMGVLAVAASHPGLTVPALAIAGVGMGLFIPANNAATISAAPIDRGGAAGGLLNMARGLGTAIGVSVTAIAFAAGRGMITVALLMIAVSIGAGLVAVGWSVPRIRPDLVA